VADFMPLLWAFGGDLLNDDGKPVVDSPEAVEALKFMLALGKVSPPGYTGFNADEVSAHMLQSTAVQSINWPAWITAMDDSAKSKVVGKVGFSPMPGQKKPGQPELGNWLLAIPAGSKKAETAFQFILWATEPAQMKIAAMRGNPPTRKSVFKDAELVKKFRAYPVQLASLESAKPRPRTRLWNEIENAFGIYLSKANSGSLSPEQALKQANDEIKSILARDSGLAQAGEASQN
jgi:multiple sugar transport system substrate-binding protein